MVQSLTSPHKGGVKRVNGSCESKRAIWFTSRSTKGLRCVKLGVLDLPWGFVLLAYLSSLNNSFLRYYFCDVIRIYVWYQLSCIGRLLEWLLESVYKFRSHDVECRIRINSCYLLICPIEMLQSKEWVIRSPIHSWHEHSQFCDYWGVWEACRVLVTRWVIFSKGKFCGLLRLFLE